MKKILIVGANGYIGSRLSKFFYINGYSVAGVCYPKIPNDLNWQNYFTKIYQLDVRDSAAIDKVSNNSYDVLINLVSLDHHQSESDANFVTSINVSPTLKLLKKFSEKNNLEKFIYFSTIQVYGKLPSENISEEREPQPKNIYGLTHYLSEQICNYFNNNSEIICINVRLSNSYGSPVFNENNCWWLVINDLCKTAFNKNKIILHSDGSPQRDFIHSSDVSRAIMILIDKVRKDFKKNTYHISSGITLTILELAHTVKRIFQKRYNKEITIFLPDNSISENPDRFIWEKKYIINNSKLKSLGFKQQTNLEAGINELFDYLEIQNDA